MHWWIRTRSPADCNPENGCGRSDATRVRAQPLTGVAKRARGGRVCASRAQGTQVESRGAIRARRGTHLVEVLDVEHDVRLALDRGVADVVGDERHAVGSAAVSRCRVTAMLSEFSDKRFPTKDPRFSCKRPKTGAGISTRNVLRSRAKPARQIGRPPTTSKNLSRRSFYWPARLHSLL